MGVAGLLCNLLVFVLVMQLSTETNTLMTCRRRASDSIERRFCFDITVGTSEKNQQMTLQALSDDDLQAWLLAMDGKEPVTSLAHLTVVTWSLLYSELLFSDLQWTGETPRIRQWVNYHLDDISHVFCGSNQVLHVFDLCCICLLQVSSTISVSSLSRVASNASNREVSHHCAAAVCRQTTHTALHQISRLISSHLTGLEEQGLYRIVGVASKVTKLTNTGLGINVKLTRQINLYLHWESEFLKATMLALTDRKKAEKLDLSDSELWETKTVTSALKNYFR